MKKFLRTIIIILLLLWFWFFYIVKNPELPISQKVLTTIGLNNTVTPEQTGTIVTPDQWTLPEQTDTVKNILACNSIVWTIQNPIGDNNGITDGYFVRIGKAVPANNNIKRYAIQRFNGNRTEFTVGSGDTDVSYPDIRNSRAMFTDHNFKLIECISGSSTPVTPVVTKKLTPRTAEDFVWTDDYKSNTPIMTSLECDSEWCIDYTHYLGWVSKDIARIVSIYSYNGGLEQENTDKLIKKKIWDISQYPSPGEYDNISYEYYKTLQSLYPGMIDIDIQAMNITDKEAIQHIKAIDLIQKYYRAIYDENYADALSLTTWSNKTVDRYRQTYENNKPWIETEHSNTEYMFEYKWNNTYYFEVTTTGPLSWDMLYYEDYGVTKQIVGDKLRSISSKLLSGYRAEEWWWEKPVIYLYPKEKTEVNVRLNLNWSLSSTYPEISKDNTWTVTAHPDGTLVDANQNSYSYLFREAKKMPTFHINEWFVVAKKDYAKFLQDKLSYLGLTAREYNEFIVYRLPRMQKYSYVKS